jgi:hypothetical protein
LIEVVHWGFTIYDSRNFSTDHPAAVIRQLFVIYDFGFASSATTIGHLHPPSQVEGFHLPEQVLERLTKIGSFWFFEEVRYRFAVTKKTQRISQGFFFQQLMEI